MAEKASPTGPGIADRLGAQPSESLVGAGEGEAGADQTRPSESWGRKHLTNRGTPERPEQTVPEAPLLRGPKSRKSEEVIPNPVTVTPGRRPFLPAASPSRRRPLKPCARSWYQRRRREGGGSPVGRTRRRRLGTVAHGGLEVRPGLWTSASSVAPFLVGLRVRSFIPLAARGDTPSGMAVTRGWCWIRRRRSAQPRVQALAFWGWPTRPFPSTYVLSILVASQIASER